MIPQNWPRTLQNWGKIILWLNKPQESQRLYICSVIFTELLLRTTSPPKYGGHYREQPDKVPALESWPHGGRAPRLLWTFTPPHSWALERDFVLPGYTPPPHHLLLGSTGHLAHSYFSSLSAASRTSLVGSGPCSLVTVLQCCSLCNLSSLCDYLILHLLLYWETLVASVWSTFLAKTHNAVCKGNSNFWLGEIKVQVTPQFFAQCSLSYKQGLCCIRKQDTIGVRAPHT